MRLVADVQRKVAVLFQHETRAQDAHGIYHVTLLPFLVAAPILEFQITVKAHRRGTRRRFRLPQDVPLYLGPALGTAILRRRPLVGAPVALGTHPIKGVQVEHHRHHRVVRLHVLHERDVKGRPQRTMGVELHHVMPPRQPCRLVRRCPLPDALGMVDQCQPFVVRHRLHGPGTVQDDDHLCCAPHVLPDAIERLVQKHLVTGWDQDAQITVHQSCSSNGSTKLCSRIQNHVGVRSSVKNHLLMPCCWV